MSATAYNTVAIITALVAEQKKLYAQLESPKASKGPVPLPVLEEAKQLAEGVASDINDADFFLSLHFLVLGGSSHVSRLAEVARAVGEDKNLVGMRAKRSVHKLFEQNAASVQRGQWKSEKEEDKIAFRVKVALAAYAVRILGIRKRVVDCVKAIRERREESFFPYPNVESIQPSFKADINQTFKDCGPFQEALKSDASSSAEKEALDKACSELCNEIKDLFPSEKAKQEFDEAKSAFDKAEELKLIWLDQSDLLRLYYAVP